MRRESIRCCSPGPCPPERNKPAHRRTIGPHDLHWRNRIASGLSLSMTSLTALRVSAPPTATRRGGTEGGRILAFLAFRSPRAIFAHRAFAAAQKPCAIGVECFPITTKLWHFRYSPVQNRPVQAECRVYSGPPPLHPCAMHHRPCLARDSRCGNMSVGGR